MDVDIHKEIHRIPPGADRLRLEYTRKAFQMLPPLKHPDILDAGCGEGRPTMVLAELSDADITAFDISRESLLKLQQKSKTDHVDDRIHPVCGSLLNMPFGDAVFDIIWAEATVHIVGVENALDLWRRYLKPGGFMVIHECIWLRENPPKEAADYWKNWFAGIRTAEHFTDAITAAGYNVRACFKLPEDLWWHDYFQPLAERIAELRRKYHDDRQALEALDRAQVEVDMRRKYPGWFGTGFFIAQRPDSDA